MTDYNQERERPAGPPPERADPAKESFDELTGLNQLRLLPAILVSVPLGITVFCLVAALLGVALFGFGAILHLTGPIATGLGLTWFGGSLAITGLLMMRVLRRINAALRSRDMPTLY